MKEKDYCGSVAVAVLLLSSCSSSKKFVYLQDMEMGLGYPYDTRYEAVVHANDRLDITVSSKNPELSIPFNAGGGAFSVGANGAGVKKVAGWFRDAGVKDLTVRLYPEGRHEMLNEANRDEVYRDVLSWLERRLPA